MIIQQTKEGQSVPIFRRDEILQAQQRGPPGPLLRPPLPEDADKICFVIDLDETLVHSNFRPFPPGVKMDIYISVKVNGIDRDIGVQKRPGCDNFLYACDSIFECVLFTASDQEYADQVINCLDPKKRIFKHRLFKKDCIILRNRYFIKDLSRLGRDLKRVVIVDNFPLAYALQPENAIPIGSYYGDNNDTELLELIPFVIKLAKVPNVYDILKSVKKESLQLLRSSMGKRRRVRWFDLQNQAASTADEYKYFEGTGGAQKRQECTSDRQCTKVLGQLCFAVGTSKTGSCHCPRTKPIIIPQTEQQRGYICVEHRLLFEKCRYNLECTYTDLNLRCTDGLCICPKPLHISHTGLCIKEGQLFSAAGVEQPWTLMGVIFSVFLLGLCIPFLLDTFRHGVGPLHRLVRDPPVAAAIQVDIAPTETDNKPSALSNIASATAQAPPIISSAQPENNVSAEAPKHDTKHSNILTRLENVLGIASTPRTSSSENPFTSIALLRRIDKGDFEPTISIDHPRPSMYEKIKQQLAAIITTRDVAVSEQSFTVSKQDKITSCAIQTQKKKEVKGVMIQPDVICAMAQTETEPPPPVVKPVPIKKPFVARPPSPLRSGLSPGSLFHAIYTSAERMNEKQKLANESKATNPEHTCSTCITHESVDEPAKTQNSSNSSIISNGSYSDSQPLEHFERNAKSVETKTRPPLLTTPRLLGLITPTAKPAHSIIFEEDSESEDGGLAENICMRVASPEDTRAFSLKDNAHLIKTLMATKINDDTIEVSKLSKLLTAPDFSSEGLYEMIKDVLREEFSQYMSQNDCSTLRLISSINEEEEEIQTKTRKVVRFDMPPSSSSQSQPPPTSSDNNVISNTTNSSVEQAEFSDEIAPPQIPEDSDMSEATKLYWLKQKDAERRLQTAQQFFPLFQARSNPYSSSEDRAYMSSNDHLNESPESYSELSAKIVSPELVQLKSKPVVKRTPQVDKPSPNLSKKSSPKAKPLSSKPQTSSVPQSKYRGSPLPEVRFNTDTNSDNESSVRADPQNKDASLSTLGELSDLDADSVEVLTPASRSSLPTPFDHLVNLLQITDTPHPDETVPSASEVLLEGDNVPDNFYLQLIQPKMDSKKSSSKKKRKPRQRSRGDGCV